MRNKLLVLLGVLALAESAIAHDGGFGHSRRAMYVTTAPGEFILEYRIRQNPDEALLQMTLIDQDGDGKISKVEKDHYFSDAANKLAERLKCTTTKGQAVRVEPVRFELQQALTQVFRFRIATNENELLLTDQVFPHKPGVIQIVTGANVKAQLSEKVDLTHAERVTVRLSRTHRP